MTIADRTLVEMFETMTRIRLFEERVTLEYQRGDMPGFVHTYIGAEAVAAGVCAHLTDRDLIASTHRGHGHSLAKGCSIAGMLAELYGRETGLCKGRGGSMHIADFEIGMLGANAIVGGSIGLATGGAFAQQVKGTSNVSVSFFGDGGSGQGILYESMNLASIWKLPVIYVCENNGWAESTPVSYSQSVADLSRRADGFGIPGRIVDGADVFAVHQAAGEAVERARRGDGPSFIEAKIPRISAHYVGDTQKYRNEDDLAAARRRDPLKRLQSELSAAGLLDEADIERIRAGVVEELDRGVAAAKADPWPTSAGVTDYVYSGAYGG
ncbi:MAG: thiamine pyrophosphate-dependent dehydrogenase E1 component subunit alpha [bacterium]|nr:thiamine pyrophosphate-dependent dehydrogenase E1 component subunit alpha [bacterium]MDE0288820.1 thiamine pyrophosphate-dependent dehydrogenase E1 component subunit alpha [bacterium]MDE0438566.1 thiamine pyrophosphate-dependent dehydrogenase E1 component subunit alpha [bacterium]